MCIILLCASHKCPRSFTSWRGNDLFMAEITQQILGIVSSHIKKHHKLMFSNKICQNLHLFNFMEWVWCTFLAYNSNEFSEAALFQGYGPIHILNNLCCRGWQIGNRKQVLKIQWNYKPDQNSRPFLETPSSLRRNQLLQVTWV